MPNNNLKQKIIKSKMKNTEKKEKRKDRLETENKPSRIH